MNANTQLGSDGQQLLRLLVNEINKGRVKKADPKTFVPYSEALRLLGAPNPSFRAGKRLQTRGLNALNDWTIANSTIPKIAGLIVNKKTHEPSHGYPESHGRKYTDPSWKRWWIDQTTRAIEFDWQPYV